jgi:segregation and condensation protein A
VRKRPILNVDEESVTVGQMLEFIRRRLVMQDRPLALSTLLKNTRSERALICMFLALLEMVRLQAILLRQDRSFGEILVKKHASFESLMSDGNSQVRDDWR